MSRKRRVGWWWLALLATLMMSPVAAWCCNVPVFRYALENWQPDSYHVLVLSRGALNETQQESVRQLEMASVDDQRPANLQVHAVDLEQGPLADTLRDRVRNHPPAAADLEQLAQWASEQALDEPMLVAFYPRVWDRIAWQATLTAEHVNQLIDSPLRQEIARRLLDGQSSVWVLLESGDRQRDDQAWEVLQAELTRSMQVVQLPARELIETDEFFRPEVPIELRVEFSAVRLPADDPAEQAFASLLRGTEADLREFNDPIAIPIYGRGRTYFALVGAGVNADTIEENGHFLCGACSCQVKEDNPGLDVLMAVNWAAQVTGTAMPQVVLPELTGIGALDLAATGPGAVAPPTATDVERSSDAAAVADAGTAQADRVAPDLESELDDQQGPLPDVRPADDELPAELTSQFQRSLLIRVAGGVAVAVLLLSLATFWLRRTL